MACDSPLVDRYVFKHFSSYSSSPADGAGGTDATEEGVLPEAEYDLMRQGRAKFRWTLCNPFRDRRLSMSFYHLAVHTVVMIVALACVTMVACVWTSRAPTSAPAPPEREGTSSCKTAKSCAELRALLLSVDIPIFICLGIGYALALAIVTSWSQPTSVALLACLELILACAGAIVVAAWDPVAVWGGKGSIGFAGAWAVFQNLVGIACMSMALVWGPPDERIVRNPWSALRFGFVLFASASSLQGMLYLVEFFTAQGIHDLVGIACFFTTAFCIISITKHCIRQWRKVTPLACCFMLYWFQAGAYLTFRLFLQGEPELSYLALSSAGAAILEVVLRLGVVIGGKIVYNVYVDKGLPDVALRILDLHVVTLIVDILAEWSAIAISAVCSAAIDAELFDGLTSKGNPGTLVASITLQAVLEILADVVSLAVAFAVLPVSLEGILNYPGYVLAEASCAVVSLLFVFTTLNMRIRIERFVP